MGEGEGVKEREKRSLAQAAKARWVDWWWIDLIVVAVAVLVCLLVVRPGTGVDALGRLSLGERRLLYTDLLTIATFFAGFASVAFTAYLGLSGRSVELVRRLSGERILRVWIAEISIPWFAALGIWIASLLDAGTPPTNPARWFALGAMLLIALVVARSTWLFGSLAGLALEKPAPATIATAATPITSRRRAG